MSRIVIKVETYSGHKADERPRSLTIRDRTIGVKEVLDQWYGEGYDYFKVCGDDGYNYLIRHNTVADEWEVVMMERADRPLKGR